MNEILGHCAPFQIIKSVVILFSIFVVRLVSWFWWSDECEKYKSMYKKRMSCAMFAESDDQISCPDTPRLKNLELPASMRLATCNDPSITYQVLDFVTRNWTPFFRGGIDLVRHVAFHVKVACSEMRTASNRSHFAMSQAEA
jgi:hypothetical protein